MVGKAVRVLAVMALVGASLGSGGGDVAAASPSAGPVADSGTLQGAAYQVDIPSPWNGILLLYSHGYVQPGDANPARDAGDPATHDYLLHQGYALAGSAYKTSGWAVQDALVDQINLLNYFDRTYGTPEQTIAWGHSLGGMITAGLVQRDPRRFAGALPMCGVLAGGIGTWNAGLDSEFVASTLLAHNASLQLVNITNPTANLGLAEDMLTNAQATPQGRARLALSAAVAGLPGWFDPTVAEPAANDYASREQNQFQWDQQVDYPFVFAFRADMERRAGGNPSWNVGVDYRRQLAQSVDRDEVEALYRAAGLSLDRELHTLQSARRVVADPGAVGYLTHNIVYDGDIDHLPVLTMHTTADGLVVNQQEQAYASIADRPDLLRQTFVHRAGHCGFTPAETIAALQVLEKRIQTGQWPGLEPGTLNAAAAALGPLNVFAHGNAVMAEPPAFVPFHPARFPRPFAVPFDFGGVDGPFYLGSPSRLV